MIYDISDEDTYIGTINLFSSELITEATTKTSIPKIGDCDIIVRGNEGQIPHFHIISKDKSFESCVCIEQPRYFKHSNKNGELNRKQRIALNNFLKTKISVSRNFHRYITIWEFIVISWNIANSHRLINVEKQPDYTTMIDSIHL